MIETRCEGNAPVEANGQKLKLLHLIRILSNETDEKHGLTMPQIIEKLASQGISAERKSIYRDIAALREFGYDIEVYHRAPVEYAMTSRPFEISEIVMLIDAVQGSRHLTQSKSDSLVRRLKTFASKPQSKMLGKRLYVDGRVKMQNESVFRNVDLIQEAIQRKRMIEFRTFRYDVHMRRKVIGDDVRLETPVVLTYTDGYYYAVTFEGETREFRTYRVDRMVDIFVSERAALRCDEISLFDAAEHERWAFFMYGGEPVRVSLRVHEDAMGDIVDRFGEDVEVSLYDESHAIVNVDVMGNAAFFGWLAQFGSSVSIESPSEVKQQYRSYLQAILEGIEA